MARGAGDDEETVEFPVPRRYLANVVQLLARLEDSPRAPRRARDNHERPWTKDDLRWLRQLLEERPIALQLLDCAADFGGDPLTFEELCSAMGEVPQKARGELASLTSIVRNHFGRTQSPAERHWENGGFCYRMRPDIGALWLEIAEGR